MISKKLIERLRAVNEELTLPRRLPSAAEVTAMEKKLKLTLHPDFRQYFLELSDIICGSLEPVTLTDDGSHTFFPTVCQEAWDDHELPRDLVPVCADSGDYYAMKKKGEIVYWSADGDRDDTWPNLEAWLEEVWLGENEDDDEE